MSVIQKIRDKYAKISVIAIALALLGFILMDAFSGRSSLFGRQSTTIGSVNGTDIDFMDFERKVKAQEEYQRQQGMQTDAAARQQLLENTWNQEVNQILLKSEFDELGLAVGKNELTDILFGKNPPEDLKQRFTDPNTGIYNTAQAQQLINQVKRSRNQAERDQLNQYLAGLEQNRMLEKYSSLLGNSINIPKWFIEKQNADNSQLAKISYVAVPYSTIADSTIKISDAEIKEYVNKHKDEFEQKESRSITYVLFDAAPTAGDSAAIKKQVEALKSEFAAAADAATFLNRYGSSMKYSDTYTGKSQMQTANKQMQMEYKDSVLSLGVNQVYGPYLDGGTYTLAKVLDIKTLPDSAKVRHILIQTGNPQDGSVMLDDSTASKRADSINTALAGGANFDSLVKKYSDDKGSVDKGGIYDFFPQGQMVKEFNDFSFEGKVGERKVVKTQFGYHIVEILGQKGSQPYYKVAYFSKPIIASDETENNASNQAIQFAGDSRDLKTFESNYEKNKLREKGVNKLIATAITPNAFTIEGIGTSRELVKEIYKADRGDVLQPVRVGDKYVVAAVTDVAEEGLASAANARPRVEPVLINKKKAEQIKKKIGKVSTLEAVASLLKQPVQTADSIRLNNAQNPSLGFETKIIGAAFNPANKSKVVAEPIEGQAGVYVIRVDNVSATSLVNANIEEQRKSMQMQMRQQMMYRNNPSEILKRAAEIKDRRAKFY